MRRLRTTLAAVAIVLGCGVAAQARATLILLHGAVYTEEPAQPWATTVVIRDGKIAYVGDEKGVASFRDRDARVIDLAGRTVLPGFHDAHAHPMSGAMRLLRCNFADAKTPPELFAQVRRCAATHRSDPWLIGYDWPDVLAHHLARTNLDALVPDRPAFLTNTDGYKAWVNTKALAIAGVGGGPKLHRPPGLLERDATDLVRRRLPLPTQSEYRAAFRLAAAIANRHGITSIFDAAAYPPMLDAYHAADLANALTLRVVAAQVVDPARDVSQVDEMIRRRDRAKGRRFRADAAKFFLDEEIGMHTAAMLAPYADKPGSRGQLFFTQARLDALVGALDARGFLIHMHAMGDRAVRAGLDALEEAAHANGPRDRRPQIAHLGVVSPDDIGRFGRLGVAANFQPLWFGADDPAAAPTDTALGPLRARRIMPMASIARSGGRIVGGSDWPATPLDPLAAIQASMTRQPMNGNLSPRQPAERISLAAAIAAFTKNAAWVVREDMLDGTIRAGKAADLVVLDRNLFRTRVSDIHRVRVLLTLLDGDAVYRDPAFRFPERQ